MQSMGKSMSIEPVFKLSLGQVVLPGKAVLGHFDGVNPTIACVTTGGKVFLHQAKDPAFSSTVRTQDDAVSKKVRYLSVNNAITALGVMKKAIGGKDDALQKSASAHLFAAPSEDHREESVAGATGTSHTDEASSGPVDRDVLLIGTDSNLQIYDTELNKDITNVETNDDVSALASGTLHDVPVIISGGSATLTGYDASGNTTLWSHTDASATAVAFSDLDHGLLVATESNTVHHATFTQPSSLHDQQGTEKEVTFSLTEPDRITSLLHIAPGIFACGLQNGSISVYANRPLHELATHVIFPHDDRLRSNTTTGVKEAPQGLPYSSAFEAALKHGEGRRYPPSVLSPTTWGPIGVAPGAIPVLQGKDVPVVSGTAAMTRQWRVRGTGAITCLTVFDFDGDGIPELIIGRASGLLEVRKLATGEVVYTRQNLVSACAALFTSDYLRDGRQLLLVLSSSGELMAFQQNAFEDIQAYRKAKGMPPLQRTTASASAPAPVTSKAPVGPKPPAETLPVPTLKALEGVVRNHVGRVMGVNKDRRTDEESSTGREVVTEEMVEALRRHKAALEAELRQLESTIEEQQRKDQGIEGKQAVSTVHRSMALHAVPDTVEWEASLVPSIEHKCLLLAVRVHTPNLCIVSASVVSSEGSVFRNRSKVMALTYRGAKPRGRHLEGEIMFVPLTFVQDKTQSLRVEVTIASRINSPFGKKFTRYMDVPKYASYMPLTEPYAPLPLHPPTRLSDPSVAIVGDGAENNAIQSMGPGVGMPSGVVFFLTERSTRCLSWLTYAFPTAKQGNLTVLPTPSTRHPQEVQAFLQGQSAPREPYSLDARFLCLRGGGKHVIRIAALNEMGGLYVIQSENMELVFNVFQDLTKYLGTKSLSSTLYFENIFHDFEQTLRKLQELNQARKRQASELSTVAEETKQLVILAEDARLRAQIPQLKSRLGELRGTITNISTESRRRTHVQRDLVECLRKINKMINTAAGLRCGKHKANIIAESRKAIAKGQPLSMLPILISGTP